MNALVHAFLQKADIHSSTIDFAKRKNSLSFQQQIFHLHNPWFSESQSVTGKPFVCYYVTQMGILRSSVSVLQHNVITGVCCNISFWHHTSGFFSFSVFFFKTCKEELFSLIYFKKKCVLWDREHQFTRSLFSDCTEYWYAVGEHPVGSDRLLWKSLAPDELHNLDSYIGAKSKALYGKSSESTISEKHHFYLLRIICLIIRKILSILSCITCKLAWPNK